MSTASLKRAASKAAVAGAIIAIIIAGVAGYFGGRASVPASTSTVYSKTTTTVLKTVTAMKTITKLSTSYVTLTKTSFTTSVTTSTAVKTKTLTTTTTSTTTAVSTTTSTVTAPPTVTALPPPLLPKLSRISGGVLHTTVIYLIEAGGTTRVMTLKRGVVDTGATPPQGSIPPDRLSALIGTSMKGFKIIKSSKGLTLDIIYIVLNCLKPPFNNILVRKALAYATPYEMIYRTIYLGTVARLPGVIPKGMPGWTDYNTINYTLNMKLAEKLIKESGINPSKYTITILYNQGNPQRAKVAVLLSQFWGQLGFKILVKALSWPQLLERTEKPQFDVYIQDWLPDYIDPDDYTGPLAFGGTKFDFVHVYLVNSAADVAKYLSSAKVIDTPKYFVAVGPAGSGAKVSVSGKPIIVVQYKLAAKQAPPASLSAFNTIDPAFYRNTTLDALIMAGRYELNPVLRVPIYQAVEIVTNHEVPMIWLGQYKLVRVYWNWMHGRYVNPVLGERFDLIWESPNAPSIPIGIENYYNNASTLVLVTNRWPQSFDPAKDYETIGWAIFHQIGDTLVTYWKSDTSHVVPDAAVAWGHSANGTVWFFVIRGGMKAYDPWHHKVYPVNATDALFTLWRIARLGLDPSWMITSFINVNASKALTESEFNKLLSKEPIYVTLFGKTYKITSLKEMLALFHYSGPTAGVLMLKLYNPYPAILDILADPFTMIIPAKYLFDNVKSLQGKYLEAMKAAEWGKNPSAWAKYIGTGEKEPTHLYLNKYPVGTGPYYVKEYKIQSYIVLKINPYYWDKQVWSTLYGYTPKG